ncbi:MAG: glycyl-radical enzyme activating protein [Christensenella sp.]|uniref:glycyl-radical enzyme activating protein n=1 Tax=Christensenella sp. TaxID=1935934 RepID=UPI002B1EC574|nr:glycyl-radical enzyme activating protein [Christensenella sp.]MEA5001928.1 glycyl-radical enzyme activating protein [Christensenella sp.]
MIKGKIYNIERYHMHDGSGIRTIVFLKGCPLSCPWCCNPESQSMQDQLAFSKHKCVGCGRCIAACPREAISATKGGILTDRDLCTNCGACVSKCFYDARTLFGRDMTVDEVMDEIAKDREYYVRSEGGVTFSGGEATMQPDFVRECIRRCSLEFIDTAVETCGATLWAPFWRALEYAGEVLFDIKTLNETQFCTFSGCSVERVLENLKKLRENNKNVRLRCPIVPGFNQNKDFIRRVIALAKENGIKRIDLLPFHQLGSYKYQALDMEYSLANLKTLDRKELEPLAQMVHEAGLLCVVGG